MFSVSSKRGGWADSREGVCVRVCWKGGEEAGRCGKGFRRFDKGLQSKIHVFKMKKEQNNCSSCFVLMYIYVHIYIKKRCIAPRMYSMSLRLSPPTNNFIFTLQVALLQPMPTNIRLKKNIRLQNKIKIGVRKVLCSLWLKIG